MRISKQSIYQMLGILLMTAGAFFSSSTADAMRNGIRLCIEQLIPALFLFLIAVELLSPTAPFGCKKISKIPNGFGKMLLLTAVGGYPIGAISIRRALQHQNITTAQAKQLACVLFCGGPGFFLNVIGSGLYHNPTFGLLLTISQWMILLFGTAVWLMFWAPKKVSSETGSGMPENASITVSLPAAVKAASLSMVNICASVVLFFGIRGIIHPLLSDLPALVSEILSGLLEVTSGCSGLHAVRDIEKATLTAFFCGFGGICVHLQIYGILREAAPKYPIFLAVRLLLAGCGAGMVAWIFPYLPQQTISCISMPNGSVAACSTDSAAVMFMLLVTTVTLCASFVTYLRRE